MAMILMASTFVQPLILLFRHRALVDLKDQPKGLRRIDGKPALSVSFELVAAQLRQLSGQGQVGHGAELIQPLGDPFGILPAVSLML